MLRVRIPGSACRAGARQCRAVQRRQGRRRRARLSRRQRPVDRHRRYRDRPADPAHQVDQGRYRHRRPHRPGQHRAARRQPQGAEAARRGRGDRHGSPRSPPTRRRSPTCWKPRRTSSRAPTGCSTNLEGFVTDVRGAAHRYRSRTPRNSRRRSATMPTASTISWPASPSCRNQLAGASDKLEFDARRGRRADQVGRQGAGREDRRQCRNAHQESQRDQRPDRRRRRRGWTAR